MKTQILIVEDDMLVADGLKDILDSHGYEILLATKQDEVMLLLKQNTISLVLLDIELGEENGYDICRAVRGISDVPILFLTAYTGEMELVRAFQAGGDDYLTKPFRLQELIMRVQALIRRYKSEGTENLESGDLIYDRKRKMILSATTQEKIELTPVELKLMEALMGNYPQTLTRSDLLYNVWDREATFVEENTLNVNMSRLREKLGQYHGEAYIVTVRGTGYRWNISVRK